MTSTGLLLIPLGFALLLMPWHVILIALPSFALLHGAAVLNIGSVGLQPGYFLALLVITRTFLENALLRQPLDRNVMLRLLPLALLVTISVLVLWAGVALFEGKVVVIGGTDGYDLERARPYRFRRENLTQITYIVINTLLVYVIAHQATRMRPARILQVVDRGVITALILAVVVCAWQLTAYNLGLYFPVEFFFSNAGYYRADSQGFFGHLRLNGPFTEPSALSYFFSAFLLYSWKRYRLQPTLLSTSLVLVSLATVFLAYSTTGYVVLAVFAMIAALDLLPHFIRHRTGSLRITPRGVAVSVLLLLAITGAALWLSRNWDALNAILEIALFNKDETSSFETRSGSDLMALEVFAETGGLGIGLGSHRPNSLLLTLLSNVGVAGTAVFGLFILNSLWPRRSCRVLLGSREGLTVTPLRFFVIGLLLVHAISNPNLNVVILWIGFGLIVGYLASLQRLTLSLPTTGLDELEDALRRQRARPVEAVGGRS
jgi:hypothetical protein